MMDRTVWGVYVWQWLVGLILFFGFNLGVTLPMAIEAYEQTHPQTTTVTVRMCH